MSDTNSPAEIHVLRPRKVSASKGLDGFLDEQRIAPRDKPKSYDDTRPSFANINAIYCAVCDEIEYLTRDYCRCGHYLRGQLEDEYIVWENGVHLPHAKLAEEVELKLKPLRFFFCLATVFFAVPTLQMNFLSNSMTFRTFLWVLPGVVIGGAVALVEGFLSRPLKVRI
jgi:hypothetical protein